MGYLDIDLASPIISAYVTDTRTRNLLLKFDDTKWPTKYVGGVEVFDELPLVTHRFGGIVQNDRNNSIYKVLGMSAKKLAENDLSQVNKLWLYLKPKPFDRDEMQIDAADVARYINSNIKLYDADGTGADPDDTGEVRISVVYTQKVASQNLRALPTVSDEQIIAMIEGGYNSIYPVPIVENSTVEGRHGDQREVTYEVYRKMVNYDTKTSKVTFASLMDTNDDLFESYTKITDKRVVPAYAENFFGQRYISSYTIEAEADYVFRRIKDAGDVGTTELVDTIVDKANNETKMFETPIYRQIADMLHTENPITVSTDLYHVVESVESDDVVGDVTTYKSYVKVGVENTYENGVMVTPGYGLKALKPKEFAPLFASLIDTDFEQYTPKKKWYSGLLTIVVIVVAVVLAYISAGALSPVIASATGVAASAATFMTAFALTLSLAVVAVGSLARATAGRSQSFAMAVGRAMITVGKIAEIVGYIATILTVIDIVNNIKTAIGGEIVGAAGKEAAKEAAKQAAVDSMTGEALETAGAEAVKEVSIEAFKNASMKEIMVATGNVIYNSITEMATNAMNNVVGAFNGSLFSNTSTIEVLGKFVEGLNVSMNIFNMISPRPDPSTPVVEDEIPAVVPSKIEDAELLQRYSDSTYAFDPICTEDMCYGMTEKTIVDKTNQYYIA